MLHKPRLAGSKNYGVILRHSILDETIACSNRIRVNETDFKVKEEGEAAPGIYRFEKQMKPYSPMTLIAKGLHKCQLKE